MVLFFVLWGWGWETSHSRHARELDARLAAPLSDVGQFELAAAITPFLTLPAHWFEGRPVELWVDNSGALGGLIKGYSGVPDCAKIINLFHFAFARLGAESLWVDYVPSESNPADVPSRLHEMTPEEAASELAEFGDYIEMKLPDIADENGQWLSYQQIAASLRRQ